MRVTTSLMPMFRTEKERLVYPPNLSEVTVMGIHTWIFRILRADILVACIEDILIHECCSRCNLTEEADLDRLTDLYTLTLLHEDLSSVLAPVFAIQARNTVLFWVMAFFKWLQGGHQVVSTCDTGRHYTLSNSSCNGTFDNGGDRIHGPYYF